MARSSQIAALREDLALARSLVEPDRRQGERRSPVAEITLTWSPWLSSAVACVPAAPRWLALARECGGPTGALERAVRDGWVPAVAGRQLDHWARPGEDGYLVHRDPLGVELQQWDAYQELRRRRDEATAAKEGRG